MHFQYFPVTDRFRKKRGTGAAASHRKETYQPNPTRTPAQFMGCTSSLFAGLQVRWYYIVDFIVDFQWVFVGNQCRAGNFKNRRSGVSFFRSNCNKIIKKKHDHNNKLLPEHNINKVR